MQSIQYPKIGIRPVIDGRWGGVRESLEAQTMGMATMAACAVGGPPNTTYSEVTGAVTLTRAFNPAVMTWAALCAILLSFLSKLGAFLSSIPTPVMGGIMILLFGAIMVVNLAIGFVTPPIGVNLFVASSLTEIPVTDIARQSLPMLGWAHLRENPASVY